MQCILLYSATIWKKRSCLGKSSRMPRNMYGFKNQLLINIAIITEDSYVYPGSATGDFFKYYSPHMILKSSHYSKSNITIDEIYKTYHKCVAENAKYLEIYGFRNTTTIPITKWIYRGNALSSIVST